MSDERETYTCDRCGGKFMSDWTDEEAGAEYEELFGRPLDEDKVAVVCEDCYQALITLSGMRPQ